MRKKGIIINCFHINYAKVKLITTQNFVCVEKKNTFLVVPYYKINFRKILPPFTYRKTLSFQQYSLKFLTILKKM